MPPAHIYAGFSKNGGLFQVRFEAFAGEYLPDPCHGVPDTPSGSAEQVSYAGHGIALDQEDADLSLKWGKLFEGRLNVHTHIDM